MEVFGCCIFFVGFFGVSFGASTAVFSSLVEVFSPSSTVVNEGISAASIGSTDIVDSTASVDVVGIIDSPKVSKMLGLASGLPGGSMWVSCDISRASCDAMYEVSHWNEVSLKEFFDSSIDSQWDLEGSVSFSSLPIPLSQSGRSAVSAPFCVPGNVVIFGITSGVRVSIFCASFSRDSSSNENVFSDSLDWFSGTIDSSLIVDSGMAHFNQSGIEASGSSTGTYASSDWLVAVMLFTGSDGSVFSYEYTFA